MRPNQRFQIINAQKTSFDAMTFTALYLPLLGKTAFSLYQLLRTQSSGQLSALMAVVNVGAQSLETALDRLSALALLDLYDSGAVLGLAMRSPLTYEQFLADDLLYHELTKALGATRVKALQPVTPQGERLSKKFSDVFAVELATDELGPAQPAPISADRLDLTAFNALMKKQALTYVNENADTLHLYSIAEKFDLDWYALFKLAEQTANADKTINTFAMTRELSRPTTPKRQLTEGYQPLVAAARSASPQSFLTQLKRQVGGFVTADEKRLLTQLTAQKMPGEVQNILIHYILIQQKNASLSARLVNRVANDWLRHGVSTAEAAVARLTDFDNKTKSRKKPSSKRVKSAPKWADKAPEKTMSAGERSQFEDFRRQALKEM